MPHLPHAMVAQRRFQFNEADAARDQANIMAQERKVASATVEIFDRYNLPGLAFPVLLG